MKEAPPMSLLEIKLVGRRNPPNERTNERVGQVQKIDGNQNKKKDIDGGDCTGGNLRAVRIARNVRGNCNGGERNCDGDDDNDNDGS